MSEPNPREMFYVRTIHPADGRVEEAGFDLTPQLPQGQVVCNLFAEFLADHPGEFRERLPFLNKGDFELEWAAAARGAAFATFFSEGRPVGMGILLSGADAESDRQMAEAFRNSVVAPMLGEHAPPVGQSNKPAVEMLQFDDRPELIPTLQLLTTALASVYFRAVQQMAAL
ncbi:MAG: hypothetical protein U0Q16_24355 [Bryobacteraceae bacterium]